MMQGLKNLSMYVEIIDKWMEIEGVNRYQIQDFKNQNPTVITIIETNINGEKEAPYNLYCIIEDDLPIMLNENDENILNIMKREKEISDTEMDKYLNEFRNIVKSHLN